MRKFKGFTLVELLVVVAIIGILATVVVISYSGAQKKARDAKVTSDISAVQQALELYYQDKSGYPGWTTGASEAVSGLSDTNITSALTPAYIATIPTPPPSKANLFYNYTNTIRNLTATGADYGMLVFYENQIRNSSGSSSYPGYYICKVQSPTASSGNTWWSANLCQ